MSNTEPVYLELSPALMTEYGKRWTEDRLVAIHRHLDVIRDIHKLAEIEHQRWADIEALLAAEGVPTAISSGVSQYGMSHLIDHINGKTAFTQPTISGLALCTAAPTSTSTGATLSEASYTTYAETNIVSNLGAASAATPSVATNSTTINGPACTAGTATLLGFALKDGITIGSGNVLWYGTLTSTVISSTQTPPTIAASGLSLSMNGT